jgi:DUF1680 family protein
MNQREANENNDGYDILFNVTFATKIDRMSTRNRTATSVLLGLCLATDALAGELTSRMELTLERVRHGGPPVYSDDFVLADAVPQHVRRFTEFSGDVSGRYLGALAAVAQFSGKQMPELDRVAAKLVPLQKPDGHFGDPFSTGAVTNSDMALLWGNGRLLIGLLEYYRLNPAPAVLRCARRLGDWFVDLAPRLNDPAVREQFSGDQVAVGYICWTQIIEGLVELNRASHEEKYLRLATQIAANTHRYPKEHSHGFVSALRGVLELYRATHDAQWLRKVETEWEGIIASGNLLPQGALPEVFRPLIANDEGCSEADWLRLNLALWTETRNLRYLDNAELTLFNEFFFNQFRTGDFGHHLLTDEGIGVWSARAWWCCTLHGLRAFPDIFHAAFHSYPDHLCYDLPVDGRGAVTGLGVQADSSLAQDASVALLVSNADGAPHALGIRQPAWASALELRLNGKPLNGVAQTNSMEVYRQWKVGDKLIVHYLLRTRLLPHPQDASRVAFLCGPWFLGVNAQNAPTFFDEPSENTRVVLPELGSSGDLPLKPAVAGNAPPVRFTAPAAYLTLPYLPGGYAVQPQMVLLRPIAEHTAIADATRWALWFQPARTDPAKPTAQPRANDKPVGG